MPDERYDTIDDVFDRLGHDARVQPIEDELMDVKTTEGLAAARDLINRSIHDGLVTASDLARCTGAKSTAISALRNDKWKGSPGTQCTLASQLCKAINQIVRQRQADVSRIDGFVRTGVAEAIFAMKEYAVKRRMMVAFVIPAGCGKTMALEAIAEDTPGSILLTVKRARTSIKSFLQMWARALGIDERGRAEDLQDLIIARLMRSDRLTLIDEAHKLQVQTLDAIREIWDETRVPIVFSGTPSFKSTLTSQRVGTIQRELLDQLYSRIGMFRDLSEMASDRQDDPGMLVTIADIQKLFARGRVRLSKDGADFLMKLANTPAAGGLRVCRDLVQIVIDLYEPNVITAELLQQALATRVGTREAGFLININLSEPALEPEPQQAAAG